MGPGVNIKRSPLCGRNFEYFSEDPYLAGRMAAAMINGMQDMGTGASLKHFALNNQETRRMKADSVVDERALRELYLPAFEYAIKNAAPYTVMCSYNRVWGEFASESKRLLTDILRHEWGYEGLVVSDWGAVSDRVAGVVAGLDLEMPSDPKFESDAAIISAVKSGELSESFVDAAAESFVRLSERFRTSVKKFSFDEAADHQLARKAAAQSAVLLKNNGALPIERGTVAVIGEFAKRTRFQGSGSSRINPTRVDNALDALMEAGLDVQYAQGYREGHDWPEIELLVEAERLAARCDSAVVFAGLPDSFESEGYDRVSLAMPLSHVELINAVAAKNPNTIVVLYGGAPMELEFDGAVNATLMMYLGGQAAASACADILTGKVNPSGKLAESWPYCAEDVPCHDNFPGHNATVEYRESIFVGYRYYLSADMRVRYPFGHGLSYTSFEYSAVRLKDERRKGAGLKVSVEVQNTGNREGAEVVQLYFGMKQPVMFRPLRQLAGFKKITLRPHETATVEFALTERDLAYYDTGAGAFVVEKGDYVLYIGSSCVDIRGSVEFKAGDFEGRRGPESYYDIARGIAIPDADFEAMLGRPIPPAYPEDVPVTLDSTLEDVSELPLGRFINGLLNRIGPLIMGNTEDTRRMVRESLPDTPLRSISTMGGVGISLKTMRGLAARLERQRKKK